MGLTVSIILIAVGAILAFAVTVTTRGIDLTTVGVILMVVGFAGWLTSLMMVDADSRWRFWGRRDRSYRDYDDDDVVEVERRRPLPR